MAMTRKELNQAFREAIMLEFVDVPDESQITFAFSEKFEQKMQKLIARQKKSYWKYVNTAKKRVAVAALLVLSVAMMLLSNEEVRASMLQWCEDVYEEYIHYYFEGETTKVIEHEYQLTMIPDGFEVVYEDKDEERCIVEYENKDGDCISLYQNITNKFEINVDNENIEQYIAIIGNKEVTLSHYGTQMSAMWIEDGYFMLLMYYGCDNIEIIKEMVENVR